MIRSLISSREVSKWGVYALAILAPGGLIILPLLWFKQYLAARAARSQTHAA